MFLDKWVTDHPDKSAYRDDYKLYVDRTLIKRFSLVWIDGFRTALAILKMGTNIIKRDEYLLSRIINYNLR